MRVTDRTGMGRILVVLLFWGCAEWGMAATTANRTNDEKRAAGALFGQFETVFYSKPGLLSGSGTYKHLSKQDSGWLRFPFAYLLNGLDSLGKPTSAEILANAEAILVGAKDFRPPKGLGPVHSRRCYVVVLRRGGTFDLNKYFLREHPVAAALAEPVWSWSAELREFGEGDPSPSQLYAAQVFAAGGVANLPRPFLLVSNDVKELQAMAERLVLREEDDPLRTLTGVREWKRLREHDYWGYRRYCHTGVVDRVAAGMTDVTPAAEALTFSVDFERRFGVVRLLSSTADDITAEKINTRVLNGNGLFPLFRPLGARTWQTIIRFTGNEKSLEGMFVMMGLFGLGGYV